ncbi:PadR family transcriptional regulator [Bacillus sp. REN3]|uniref:PadR family transcriptional regulator n=1 Tax=Bacillus sp. REN3 TaxID=2802440 RepID=UPI001AED1975|nr:PadR family transcriptional regulator [Bacillus sp. REN3]
MSIQIVILGLLAENSDHPYELKKVILENKWDRLFPITDGNLYHAIRKLKKDKCIIEEKHEQVNNRPSRTVYSITAQGKMQLSNDILEVFKQRNKEPRALYPALLFIHSTNIEKAASLIEEWIQELKEESKAKTEYGNAIPALIQEHYMRMNDFYLGWLREVLQVIKSSRHDESYG